MWNSKLDVYRTEWLDLVFANRNKAYGAYELRQHNNQTTIKAFLTASGLMITVIMLLFIYSGTTKIISVQVVTPVRDVLVDLSKITERKPPQQAPQKVEIPPAAKPLNINTKKLINLNVVSANNVIEEPITMEELKESVIGSQNIDGTLNGAQPIDASAGTGNGSGSLAASTGEEIVATEFLEKYPEFPGGQSAFAKYLGRNLRYPYAAVENNITGRVLVSFIIEKNGELSDIKVVRGIGGGCDEEAIRVLKKSPPWSPGKQNGRLVRVAYTVPIYFQLNK